LETDFPSDAKDKAVPYGIYDVQYNEGYMVVGVSHETAEFAMTAIQRWWLDVEQARYPGCRQILLQADSGGANACDSWLWKAALQTLADRFGITIWVNHFPAGASKWNLISITDGQVYLSPDLFQKGILPAVDLGKSVSRIGGKTQLSAYRAVAGDLGLSYAQFEELETFARFGTRLDEDTRRTIEHGERAREVPNRSPSSLRSRGDISMTCRWRKLQMAKKQSAKPFWKNSLMSASGSSRERR
jgi:hypothetical protein